jgi:hypothetical protein
VRIALINGSPKCKESASGALITDFLACAHEKCDCVEIKMNKSKLPDDAINILSGCEAWVFFYPLYVDGVPGHLLSCLKELEKAKDLFVGKYIYAVSNCGFYDGSQCEWSLDVIKHWSCRCGFVFGGGIGVGGGGALTVLLNMKPGDKPKSKIDKSLNFMLEKILEENYFDNFYANISIPRAIYKMAAEHGWGKSLVKNGKKRKDIASIPQ